MNCSELTTGLVAAQCGQLETAGAEDDVILIPFNTIDRANCSVLDNVIREIELVADKYAYMFSTYGKSLNEAGATFAVGTYRNSWTHSVPLRIFVKKEQSKKFVNQFGEGAKVVAILKNKAEGENGEVKYEAYGWDNGLIMTESAPTIAMADGVVYPLTLASAEGSNEGSLPKSVFAGAIAATELMLKGLLEPTP